MHGGSGGPSGTNPGEDTMQVPIGPLSPSAPAGPVGIAFPPQVVPAASTTIPSNGSSSTSSSTSTSLSGQTSVPVQTTLDDGSGTATSPPTTLDYPQFRCVVSVNEFVGGPSGPSRRVKVKLRLSTNTVRYVWTETRWDDQANVQTVTLNPEGRTEFLVFAPGTQWPTVRVFASSDLRPQSRMCNG